MEWPMILVPEAQCTSGHAGTKHSWREIFPAQ